MSAFDAILVHYGPALLAACLLLPLGTAGLLGLSLLVRQRPPAERFIARLTALTFTLFFFCAAALAASVYLVHPHEVSLNVGTWFHVEHYAFEISFLADPLSAPMLLLTATLCGLVGKFSVTYLHREPGFGRFFFLLSVFAAGMAFLSAAETIDLLFFGWELVGISSMLLIAFFRERREPSRNGLRAFVTYRVCDMGLLVGAVLLHHYAQSSDFHTAFGPGEWPIGTAHLDPFGATIIGLLFLFAAMGKSAMVPFGAWLPRAMEGPTPSSAIFYGGLSIHAGVYLLLRVAPVLEESAVASGLVVATGIVTAIYATFVGRTQADAKNTLAFSAMTQVGLMFAEIGLGLYTVAIVHLIGHACLRTVQLLRAPSALRDAYMVQAAAAGIPLSTGKHIEAIVPRAAEATLYSVALQRFALDEFLDAAISPVLRLSEILDKVESRWMSALGAPGPATPEEVATGETARKD